VHWDTLDLWFTESEIPDYIEKIINLTEKLPKVINEIEQISSEEKEVKPSPAQIDIEEIVDQVSDKFKDEIDGLKQKIDFLQHEIDEKDEKIKLSTQKKVIKITPKKNVKLPPPMIKIPVTRKPEKPPQILGQIKTDVEKTEEKIGVKSIDKVQMKIEEEIEKLKPIPASPLTPPPLPPPSQPSHSNLEVIPKEKSGLNTLGDLKPIPTKPEPKIIEEIPEETTSILEILDEQQSEYKEEEPLNIEEKTPRPKKSIISTEVTLVEDEPVEQKKSAPFLIQDPVEQEKPKPFLAQTPRISSVRVEEIETEPIKSTGTELFDVFYSVGSKPAEKAPIQRDMPSLEPIKESKKKESKKKKKASEPLPFVGFDSANSSNSQTSTAEEYNLGDNDELPKDKDSLYQELIALEGRRYSLEKTFKELERSYTGGSIADLEYKDRSDDLKYKQDEITSRINKIRRLIASM
jgi:hypothetical protein